jgi:hypothetical protein
MRLSKIRPSNFGRGANMQSVRLHVAGNGTIWVISKCKVCGEVDKHLAADAIVAAIPCGKCGHRMDMKGAAIEAIDTAHESRNSASRAAD